MHCKRKTSCDAPLFYIRLAEPYLITFTSPFFAIFTMLDGW